MSHADEMDCETANVAAEILAYLRSHPTAIDTARGVREWWLRGLLPQPPAHVVEAALERLCVSGCVRRTVSADHNVLWSAETDSPDMD